MNVIYICIYLFNYVLRYPAWGPNEFNKPFKPSKPLNLVSKCSNIYFSCVIKPQQSIVPRTNISIKNCIYLLGIVSNNLRLCLAVGYPFNLIVIRLSCWSIEFSYIVNSCHNKLWWPSVPAVSFMIITDTIWSLYAAYYTFYY